MGINNIATLKRWCAVIASLCLIFVQLVHITLKKGTWFSIFVVIKAESVQFYLVKEQNFLSWLFILKNTFLLFKHLFYNFVENCKM